MPIFAATATGHHGPAALLILALLAVTSCYVLGCWLFPFTDCSSCDGGGKHRSPSGSRFRPCRHCDGTGPRLRLGRAIWNRLNH